MYIELLGREEIAGGEFQFVGNGYKVRGEGGGGEREGREVAERNIDGKQAINDSRTITRRVIGATF